MLKSLAEQYVQVVERYKDKKYERLRVDISTKDIEKAIKTSHDLQF